MAYTSSLTPQELRTPSAIWDPPILWMQDIIDHEYALVESIPDEDRATLMPIIRFVRNTLPNPFTAVQESLHGSSVDALKNPDTAWMQMHGNHGIGTTHGPQNETEAVLCNLERNKSQDAGKRPVASMPHMCAFRGTTKVQHCYTDYNLNRHQASMPSQRVASWHSIEGPYKQSYGALPPSNVHIKPRLSLSKYRGQADEFHQLREGLSLSCSTYTSQCEPSSLTAFKRDSENTFDNVCSSLDMDSFNLEELRRSLRPPAHEMNGDVNGIQNTDDSNYDGGVDGQDDNRDEDDGNLDHDEEPDASDEEWPLYWGNDLQYHPKTSTEDHLRFPKVHCRRRNVTKKAVGWIKKRAADSSVSRVRHKRKCNLPCCTDCETETKRRKASGYGSKKCARLSTLNKITSYVTATMATNSENAANNNRQSSKARTVECASDSSEPSDEIEASQVTGEWENSPLATALATVLMNSRSRGLTFCEALQALAQEGYSMALGYESQALASHVKTTLKECPQFKELKNHRFILKAGPKLTDYNQGVLISSHNKVTSGNKNCCGQNEKLFTRELPPSQVKRPPDLMEKVDQSSTRNLHQKPHPGELECHKTDGKHWQCSQSAMPDLVYCKSHQQALGTSMATSGSSSCEIVDSCDASCYGRQLEVKKEETLETIADSSPELSIEEQHQDCQAPPIRCCRTDGKTWQCSNQAQEGSMYCERHQNRSKKGTVKRHVHPSRVSEEKKNLRSEEAIEQNPNVLHVKKFSMQLRPRHNAALDSQS